MGDLPHPHSRVLRTLVTRHPDLRDEVAELLRREGTRDAENDVAAITTEPQPRRTPQRPAARPDPNILIDEVTREKARRALGSAGVSLPRRTG